MARLSPAERRQRIIDATVELARDQGLAVTTVRDVGRQMGTSGGLIHHYFESMDEVLAAAFEQAARCDLDRAVERIDGAAGPMDKLIAFIDSYGPRDADATIQLWLDAWGEAARRPALQEVSRRLNLEWQSLIRIIIEGGVAGGVFRSADPDAAAWRLLSLLDGLAIQVVAHEPLISRAQVIDWARLAASRELGVELDGPATDPGESVR